MRSHKARNLPKKILNEERLDVSVSSISMIQELACIFHIPFWFENEINGTYYHCPVQFSSVQLVRYNEALRMQLCLVTA